jgi:hypothetical protein
MSVIDLEKELVRLIKKYNKFRSSFLIVYAGAIGKPIPDIMLSMDDYYILFDMLSVMLNDIGYINLSKKLFSDVILLLQSPSRNIVLNC